MNAVKTNCDPVAKRQQKLGSAIMPFLPLFLPGTVVIFATLLTRRDGTLQGSNHMHDMTVPVTNTHHLRASQWIANDLMNLLYIAHCNIPSLSRERHKPDLDQLIKY